MGSPPPIVFITTDTQGRDMVSAYGPAHWHRHGAADGAEVQLPATPNIDRLAARGTLFDTCIAASPLCTPARSAWYTGLPPNRNGAVCNNTAPSRAVPMLGELLAQAGYAAHHVGKWHLDAGGYDGAVRGGGGFADDTWYDLRRFYDEVGRDGANRFGGWLRGLQDERFCFAHRVVDRAIGLLQRRDSGTPLFLAVELDEPHGPTSARRRSRAATTRTACPAPLRSRPARTTSRACNATTPPGWRPPARHPASTPPTTTSTTTATATRTTKSGACSTRSSASVPKRC